MDWRDWRCLQAATPLLLLLVVLIQVCGPQPARAQQVDRSRNNNGTIPCYLRDNAPATGDGCMACWVTDLGVGGPPSLLQQCPPGMSLTFTRALPADGLEAALGYEARYRLQVAPDFQVLPNTASARSAQTWDIPHANLHVRSGPAADACSPFAVEAALGGNEWTAVDTEALASHLSITRVAAFSGVVSLPPGRSTVLAHARFFARRAGGHVMRYDVAAGGRREVAAAAAARRCYLDASGAEDPACALCWTTDSAGASQLAACPPGIALELEPPPEGAAEGPPPRLCPSAPFFPLSLHTSVVFQNVQDGGCVCVLGGGGPVRCVYLQIDK